MHSRTLIGVAVEKLVVWVSVLVRDLRTDFTTGIYEGKQNEGYVRTSCFQLSWVFTLTWFPNFTKSRIE